MKVIKWDNRKGQTILLSEGEYEELCKALSEVAKGRRVDVKSSIGRCGGFEVAVLL